MDGSHNESGSYIILLQNATKFTFLLLDFRHLHQRASLIRISAIEKHLQVAGRAFAVNCVGTGLSTEFDGYRLKRPIRAGRQSVLNVILNQDSTD